MFGRDDNQQTQNDQSMNAPAPDGVLGSNQSSFSPSSSTGAPSSSDNAEHQVGGYLTTPPTGDLTAPELPSVGSSEPKLSSWDTPSNSTPASSSASSNDTDLLGIKQQALQQLSPLVSHLEQTAEEKFRTTMMMIQASDDQSLIKVAYEAAQKITDEKARAQALLDVINEINYFTQQHGS